MANSNKEQERLDICNFVKYHFNQKKVIVNFQDKPDAILTLNNKKIGLEHTRIIEIESPKGDLINKLENKAKRIIEKIKDFAKNHGDLNYTFDITFNEAELVKVRNLKNEAEIIFNFLNSYNNIGEFELIRPQTLGNYFVFPEKSNHFSIILNTFKSGEKVDITNYIKRAIERKERLQESYFQKKVDELWLLIVNEQSIFSENFVVPKKVNIDSKLRSDWSKIFLLDRIFTKTYEI